MAYIEKDNNLCSGECYTPPLNWDGSSNNNSSSNTSSLNKESDENIGRWSWLINNFSTMTFKEKMELFLPKLHYINLRNSYKPDFDDKLSEEIVETSYRFCRNIESIKFDPDGQGIPNIILVMSPIDISAIPNESVKASVASWGNRFGFIKNNCSCSNATCDSDTSCLL